MKKSIKYLLLIISLFFAALNFNLILKPLNLVTGGTQGLAIILNHFLKIQPTYIIFFINISTLIISYFFLTKDNTKSAIIASFTYPLLVKITSNFTIPLPLKNYIILFSIIAGIICGITGGIIYKLGFSSGGTTIINLLLNRYLKIKISIANFILNTLIILLGLFCFGFIKALYSILVILIGSIIIYLILKNNSKD